MFHVKHLLKEQMFVFIFYLKNLINFAKILACNKYIVTWSESEDSSHINPYLCALFIWGDFKMQEKYMNLAIKEAQKAFNRNEVPVGCVIVQNNKVIAKVIAKKSIIF